MHVALVAVVVVVVVVVVVLLLVVVVAVIAVIAVVAVVILLRRRHRQAKVGGLVLLAERLHQPEERLGRGRRHASGGKSRRHAHALFGLLRCEHDVSATNSHQPLELGGALGAQRDGVRAEVEQIECVGAQSAIIGICVLCGRAQHAAHACMPCLVLRLALC